VCLAALPAALAQTPSPSSSVSQSSRGATAGKPTRAAAPAAPATPQRQQTLQREQRELQAELAKLKRQLAASEASLSEAADALADAEVAISKVNRRLRELGEARVQVEQQLTALARRQQDTATRQNAQEARFEQWLRQAQKLSLQDPLQLLLQGDDPNRLGRDMQYLAYLSRTQEAAINQLSSRQLELAALHAEAEEKKKELSKIEEDEDKNRQKLLEEKARRKGAQDRLTRQVGTQRQSIARLTRDEQRLGAVIDRISKVLAEQARREADRARRQAEQEAAARRSTPPTATASSPAPRPETPPLDSKVPVTAGNFEQSRGKLPLPVAGTVTARFGAPRRGDAGASAPSWKGVFISTAAGAEVRAVGAGQVVFSDWLRGFGNLLIVDHGSGYLSVYGNNETLLRVPGDRVAAGDAVALVGNTGGSETPGLYFELRFQGRPFDPLTWVAAR
jgi:septal ring factor EnvC (AmiA/AmiB activator)